MIGSFKHKALEKLYTDDNRRGLPPELIERLQLILSALAQAKQNIGVAEAELSLTSAQGQLQRVLGNYGAGELAGSIPVCK